MIFPSKHDRWVSWLLVPVVGVSTLSGFGVPLLLLVARPPNPPDPALFGVLATPAIVGVLILWMFFGTSYEITDTELVVRFGPLRRRVALDAVDEVIPKKRYSPERAMCLAWSVDRLVIKHRRPDGRPAFFSLAIAPRDQYAFLKELARRMHERRIDREQAVGV